MALQSSCFRRGHGFLRRRLATQSFAGVQVQGGPDAGRCMQACWQLSGTDTAAVHRGAAQEPGGQQRMQAPGAAAMALAAPHAAAAAAAAAGRHWLAAADPTLSKCASKVRLACAEAAAMQSRRLFSAR